QQRGMTAHFAQREKFVPDYLAVLRGENSGALALKDRLESLRPIIGMAGWALMTPEGKVVLSGGACEGWAEAPAILRSKSMDVLQGQNAFVPPRLLPMAGGGEKAFALTASRIMQGDKPTGVLLMSIDPTETLSE